ncbi:MAG TPA: threonine/serine exporter family protein [Coleofasciculaceae cyanobacterium]|jgi:uncharacterized membrane protein YjjB (DUF3815 family)
MLVMDFLLNALLSFVGTLGFAILFNTPRNALFICAAIGMGGHLLRLTAENLGMGSMGATFLGAFFVGLVGIVPSRSLYLPLVLFSLPGIICMVPSITAYKALVYFQRGDLAAGLQGTVEAGFKVGAIAAGIGTARILTDAEWGFERR